MTTYVDHFTGTDGTDLVGAVAPNGGTYQALGAWTINGNMCHSDGSGRVFAVDWGVADCVVSVSMLAATLDGGLALRCDNTLAERIVVKIESGVIYLQAWNGASYLGDVGSFPVTPFDGATLQVEMSGADYSVSFGGVLQGVATDPSAYYLSNTLHGIYAENAASFDDLTASVGAATSLGSGHLVASGGDVDALEAAPPDTTIGSGTLFIGPGIVDARSPSADITDIYGSGGISGPIAYGGMIRSPSDVTPAVVCRAFRRDDLVVPVATLDNAWGRTFQDILNETGHGQLMMDADDPQLGPDIWLDDIVRVEINGFAAFSWIVDEISIDTIAEGEEHDQVSTLSGPGLMDVLNDALVYPSRGPGVWPTQEDRVFNWTAPDFNDSGWRSATVVVNQAATSPYWTDLPDGWSDPGADWIFDHTATPEWAKAGPCYSRKAFTVGSGIYKAILMFACDWKGELYLDGQLMCSSQNDGDPSYITTQQVDITPGVHTLAGWVENDVDPEGDEVHNPGGMILSMYPIDSTGTITSSTPIVHSDATWKTVEFPPSPPGMSPGEAIIHAIQEAQARGCFPDVALNFGADVDSNGLEWPVVGDIATKVGTNVLTFLRELSATYIDFWIEPASFTLWAWVKGTRGSDKPDSAITTSGASNVATLSHRFKR